MESVSNFSAVDICKLIKECKKAHIGSLRYNGLELEFSNIPRGSGKMEVVSEGSTEIKHSESDDMGMLMLSDPAAFEEKMKEIENENHKRVE